MIQKHFGSNYKTLKLKYLAEERPLGTGGALAKAMGMVEENPVLRFEWRHFWCAADLIRT